MATFKKGDLVNFTRNEDTHSENTPVIAVAPLIPNVAMEQSYIIEYLTGWVPNAKRITQFELDANKKYLFVGESELAAA